MTTLSELPVLVLDAQATAAHPARGALVEIGWAPWSARERGALPAGRVAAVVVAPLVDVELPRAVRRLTGLDAAAWRRGVSPAVAWDGLRQAVEAVAPPDTPALAVVHFARFEEPYLRSLHERHGTGPFPFQLVCTHAVSRRLLPELPRRTLRALAGYFGAAVAPLRRSHGRESGLVRDVGPRRPAGEAGRGTPPGPPRLTGALRSARGLARESPLHPACPAGRSRPRGRGRASVGPGPGVLRRGARGVRTGALHEDGGGGRPPSGRPALGAPTGGRRETGGPGLRRAGVQIPATPGVGRGAGHARSVSSPRSCGLSPTVRATSRCGSGRSRGSRESGSRRCCGGCDPDRGTGAPGPLRLRHPSRLRSPRPAAGRDVVRAIDLPADVAVVLCGHVHRHQILRRDLRGRPLPAPVVYAGSVERTSFAEREETKGFVEATLGPDGKLLACVFHPLKARPMRVHHLASCTESRLEAEIRGVFASCPPDVVLQLRVSEAQAGATALRAARLRALAPPTANVTVACPAGLASGRPGELAIRVSANERDDG